MDPQQRMVMENVDHALENSGIPLEKAVSSKTAVFAAGFNHDHRNLLNADVETSMKHKSTGSEQSNIKQTCSSGLASLHLAAQSLKSGDSDMTVVTGGSVITHVGDIIASVILASFVLRANAILSITELKAMPAEKAAKAQEALIRQIYKNAHLDRKDTLFVEAHGTGTPVGDPIEARAISSAFDSEQRDEPLYVGALKANIGHLEGGAGIAGVVKSIMILEAGIIPPNVNFEKVNPNIPKDKWNIKFPAECISWPKPGQRRISVNSFGFGGTNAHCILDDAYHFLEGRGLSGIHRTRISVPTKAEINHLVAALKKVYDNDSPDLSTNGAPQLTNGEAVNETNGDTVNGINGANGEIVNGANSHHGNTEVTRTPRQFILSAFDKDGVKRVASDLKDYLGTRRSLPLDNEDEYLADLAYTLSQRKSDSRWKGYVVADSLSELEENLSAVKSRSKPTNTDRPPRIGFVFTGQGAQYYGMGKQFLIYHTFRKSLEEAEAYMKTLGSPWSLIDELLRDSENSNIHTPAIAHPASTAIQIALVELLASWNIYPSRVVGHSSGEIAAAYCSGRISRESAWGVAYYRGYVSAKQQSVKGSMIAVGLEQEMREYMDKVHANHKGELVVACFNSPRNNTVWGDEAMINALKELLNAENIFARKLKVQNAYHSAHMRSLAQKSQDIQMFSTITGKRNGDPELTPSYWADNMVSPVRFTDGLRSMIFQPNETELDPSQFNNAWIDEIIEVGPHSALQSAIKQTIAATASAPPVSYTALLNRSDPSIRTMLDTVGILSGKAAPINIYEVNHGFGGQEQTPQLSVNLPPYALTKQKDPFPRIPTPTTFWVYENPWLKEHVVTGGYVLPAVAYLTMVTEAVRQVTGDAVQLTGTRLRNVSIKSALVVPDTKEGVEVSLSVHPVNESNHCESTVWKWFQGSSYIAAHDDWIEHCSGYFSVEYKSSPDPIDNGCEDEAIAQA
ncbi:hypothetical protein AJ79_00946 [Helicocarpus griseus UAMH5409]|uniref:Neosartoricin B biosynthesis protein A n=1 Tax=Helicocarpus griseus UAMH5409 TaxID=1447875 RepID=A0A2B7Y980_9EURO|nr:hypothetical protein AJ79_00946 [Helicocarpus griseus UAMH5409]